MEVISNYKSKNTSLASNYLQEIVSMFDISGSQNDAHEFLVFLLDKLNIELIKIEEKYKITNNTNNNDKNSNNDINNNDEGEWEEVKKDGKTMKQTNSRLRNLPMASLRAASCSGVRLSSLNAITRSMTPVAPGFAPSLTGRAAVA